MYFEIADVTVSVPLLFAWGLLVGFVFSTVGAAGGILAERDRQIEELRRQLDGRTAPWWRRLLGKG